MFTIFASDCLMLLLLADAAAVLFFLPGTTARTAVRRPSP
jgi:hypothetical protein